MKNNREQFIKHHPALQERQMNWQTNRRRLEADAVIQPVATDTGIYDFAPGEYESERERIGRVGISLTSLDTKTKNAISDRNAQAWERALNNCERLLPELERNTYA
jgi:hypothetical protein